MSRSKPVQIVIWALIALTAFCGEALASGAEADIEVGDSAYRILTRLEAEGVIQDALLATRPISRSELMRLIAQAEARGGVSVYASALISELKKKQAREG